MVFCCNVHPVEGEGHVTATVFVAVRKMESNGEPGVCTAAIIPQKPPCNVKLPPVIEPASGWPIVPLTVNCPLLLVPPPPSIANQSME